jgi:XTP/dITP diphosphohydrolase
LGFASGNTHKWKELAALFQRSNLLHVSVLQVPPQTEVAETGETFLENAHIKAWAARQQLLLDNAQPAVSQPITFILAEDAGLVVPVLSGCYGLTQFPGVLSNRWLTLERRASLLGQHSEDNISDSDRCLALLALMNDMPEREGFFVSAMCLLSVETGETVFQTEKRLPLWITEPTLGPRGVNGFGYDPIAQPIVQGEKSPFTMAELDIHVKNVMSHRGQALAELIQFLSTLF